MRKNIKTGLENFIDSHPNMVIGQRIGLLCNPASVDKNFNHARILIDQSLPGHLKALYSPQHGFFAEKQDNMIESNDLVDPVLKIPVFSLYGQTRKPTKTMLDPIDILIIDLQDAGTRVYTFIYTVSYCLEAAKKFSKKVIVLDRPNPISGNQIEGNCLEQEFTSFVGRYPIPMRHGLTIGELTLLINNHYNNINADIEIIPMTGWTRNLYFTDTDLPWIPPSPNLPNPTSAMVYPGQVIWEGTNISEGRGTTQPFEIFGAPFLNQEKIISFIGNIPGVKLRATCFEPTSNKWKGSVCQGFQIHITDRYKYNSYLTSLKLLQAIIANNTNEFEWKAPPYEYEFEKTPIDLILGSQKLRKSIENMANLDEISLLWQQDHKDFKNICKKFYLYK